ncbi:MAG TPA: hypothetical protein VII01_03915 [Solirubrobacteraceae bacterium]
MTEFKPKLGLLPPIPGRPRLSLALTGVVPTHPTAFNAFSKIPSWPMDGNDQYGDCVLAAIAHNLTLVTTWLGSAPVVPTTAQCLTLYSQSSNPPFDPVTGANDYGTVAQFALEALAQHGIAGRKPVAFATVPNDLESLRAATAIFGSVLFMVTIDAAQEYPARLWDSVPGSSYVGGHGVMGGRYSEAPDRMGLVTWGYIADMTDAFIASQLGETWVVIWPEHFGTKAFQQGVDLATLAADYKALTGRTLPVPPPPPPPIPGGPDVVPMYDIKPRYVLIPVGTPLFSPDTNKLVVNLGGTKAARVYSPFAINSSQYGVRVSTGGVTQLLRVAKSAVKVVL